jgi:hypothetical protein
VASQAESESVWIKNKNFGHTNELVRDTSFSYPPSRELATPHLLRIILSPYIPAAR